MTADFQGSIAAKMLASQIGAGIRSNTSPGTPPPKKDNNSRGSDTQLSYGAPREKSTASNPFGINPKTMG